jgi:RimJ/RimL family protein N-acetyltransferase
MMVLRSARSGDREQIIALINVVAGEKRHLQTICYQPSAAWEKLLRVGYDFHSGMHLLVLTNGKKIFGVGRLSVDRQNSPDRPTGNLGLVIAPAWRGQGWGKKLLATLIFCARQIGYEYLRAEILQCNQRSLKLFQNFSFAATHIHKIYWPARQAWVDEVTVERCIIRPAGSDH